MSERPTRTTRPTNDSEDDTFDVIFDDETKVSARNRASTPSSADAAVEESIVPERLTASGESHLSSSFTSTIIKTEPLASSTVAYPDDALSSIVPERLTASGESHLSSSFTSTIIKTEPLASSTVAYPDDALSSIARNSSMSSTKKRRVENDENEEALSSLPNIKKEEENFKIKKEQEILTKMRIAVYGPVLGQFQTLVSILEKLPPDACFCVGPFFSSNLEEEQAQALLSGQLNLPCPVYFFDLGTEVFQLHVPKLVYVNAVDGIGDVIPLLDGRLRVAYTSPNFTLSPISNNFETKCLEAGYAGCDFLFTAEWGEGITHLLLQQQNSYNDDEISLLSKFSNQESLDVAKVAQLVRPHYHFAPSTASLDYHYFQTPPFLSSTGSLPCCKGFYALGCVTAQPGERQDNRSFRFRSSQSEKDRSMGSKKFSCFVDVTPLCEMTLYSAQDELLNAQPSPYLHNTKVEVRTADLCVSASADEVVDHDVASFRSNDARHDRSKPACGDRFSHSNRTRPDDSTSTTSTPQQMHVGNEDDEMSPGDNRNTSSNRSILSIPPLITECHYNMEEFEEPTLHILISNGKFEEAKREIGRCIQNEEISYKGFLKRKVKVESDSNINFIPRQVESFSPLGNLPIHSFFESSNATTNLSEEQRMELLELLLNEMPDGPRTSVLNGDLALPLSMACEPSINISREGCINCEPGLYSLSIDSATDKMIRLLIENYPTATIVLYAMNKSALHIMLEHRPNLALTEYFVETSKTARHSVEDQDRVIHGSLLKHGNEDEQLPIHTAIEYYAPCNVIQYLMNEFPGGLKEKMYNGDLPLHCAARFGCTTDVLDSLLCEKNGFPAAIAAVNNEGFTPLELLCCNPEVWNPDHFIPQINCEAATKKRIISYYKQVNDYQIQPDNLVPAYKFLRSMIAAFCKHLTETLNQKAASAKIQSLLKKLLKTIRKLDKKIKQVELAEKFIKQLLIDKGFTGSFL